MKNISEIFSGAGLQPASKLNVRQFVMWLVIILITSAFLTWKFKSSGVSDVSSITRWFTPSRTVNVIELKNDQWSETVDPKGYTIGWECVGAEYETIQFRDSKNPNSTSSEYRRGEVINLKYDQFQVKIHRASDNGSAVYLRWWNNPN